MSVGEIFISAFQKDRLISAYKKIILKLMLVVSESGKNTLMSGLISFKRSSIPDRSHFH